MTFVGDEDQHNWHKPIQLKKEAFNEEFKVPLTQKIP